MQRPALQERQFARLVVLGGVGRAAGFPEIRVVSAHSLEQDTHCEQ